MRTTKDFWFLVLRLLPQHSLPPHKQSPFAAFELVLRVVSNVRCEECSPLKIDH